MVGVSQAVDVGGGMTSTPLVSTMGSRSTMVAGHAAGRVADCLRRIWTDPEFDFGMMMQDPWGGIMVD